MDASGNPVGNQAIPFSALPTAIQTGINNHLPTGATALAAASTQSVRVQTVDGKTYYSTTFTSSGTTTVVTVDSTGALATLPSSSTTTFSSIPQAAQTELQALATADGITSTIAGTQSVTAYDEGNGTTVYSVTLSGTSSTTGNAITVTVASDQAGNPTVPPTGRGGQGCPSEGDGNVFASASDPSQLFQGSAFFG